MDDKERKMKDDKTFAMFFNGSPRKNWNMAKMLDAVPAFVEQCRITWK